MKLTPSSDHQEKKHLFPSQFSAVSVQTLFPILEVAFEENRNWLQDFKNDKIFVPNDLYDVVSAFEQFHGKIKTF